MASSCVWQLLNRMHQRFTPTILRFDSLPSTNIEAANQARMGAPEGLCIVANEQKAGRGRQNRTWHSPAGSGLYFSILLRPAIPMNEWPVMGLAAAVAVHDALVKVSSLETDIKWPNDMLARGRKLCGILSETVETANGRALIVGIGINLLSTGISDEIKEIATAVDEEIGRAIDREELLAAVLRSLGSYYLKFQEGKSREILDEWSSLSTYANGKHVRVLMDGSEIRGITRGLESDGALRVETESGSIETIRAGDVLALRETFEKGQASG